MEMPSGCNLYPLPTECCWLGHWNFGTVLQGATTPRRSVLHYGEINFKRGTGHLLPMLVLSTRFPHAFAILLNISRMPNGVFYFKNKGDENFTASKLDSLCCDLSKFAINRLIYPTESSVEATTPTPLVTVLWLTPGPPNLLAPAVTSIPQPCTFCNSGKRPH